MEWLIRRPQHPDVVSHFHAGGPSSSACLNDAEGYLVTAGYAAIKATEAEFVDPEASEFGTAVNYSVVNRLMPELATER